MSNFKMSASCSLCDKLFSSIGNVNKHKKEVHNVEENVIIEYDYNAHFYKCLEGCNVSFKTHMNLILHLMDIHNIEIKVRTLEFKQYRDFEIWKQVEERENNIRYTKTTGSHLGKHKNSHKQYYKCFRSGGRSILDDKIRKRRLKKQGSIKMDSYCTSRIVLTRDVETGICMATYYETHYGHGNDMTHLRLSDDIRKTVASQLLAGKSSKEILSTVKDHKQVTQQRDLLLKRKDITNIKKSFNIIEENENPTVKTVTGSYIDEIKLRHDLALISSYRADYKEKLFFVHQSDTQCPYIVKERPGAPCCQLKCVYCNICIHKFECTCKDFMKKALICVHIHFCFLNKTDIINGLFKLRNIETDQKSNASFETDFVRKQCDSGTVPSDTTNCENGAEIHNYAKQQTDEKMQQSDTEADELISVEFVYGDTDSDIESKKHKIRDACLKLIHNIQTKSYTSDEENFIYDQLKVLNTINSNDEYTYASDNLRRKRRDSDSTVEEIKIICVDN